MPLNNSAIIGRALAQAINDSEDLRNDLLPSEIINSLLLAPVERTKLTITVTGTQRNYATDSFILDHPVYGELDSSTLRLDGGYAAGAIAYTAGAFSYPGTYTGGTSTLFTYNS